MTDYDTPFEKPEPLTSLRETLDVLIVEDHHDSRTTMRMLLTLAHGHVVHEAADGETAVRLALEAKPHLALIDIGLPDISGYEVARRIREALGPGGMVLAALTGHGSEEDRRLALEAGFDFHMVKPVEAKDLARVLESARAAG